MVTAIHLIKLLGLVVTWNPLPPLIKGERVGPSKIGVTRGGTKFFVRKWG